jgi:hypothetical protein
MRKNPSRTRGEGSEGIQFYYGKGGKGLQVGSLQSGMEALYKGK